MDTFNYYFHQIMFWTGVGCWVGWLLITLYIWLTISSDEPDVITPTEPWNDEKIIQHYLEDGDEAISK